MDENRQIFSVKHGSIYKNSTGCIIDKIAFIIDKNASVLKYGDANSGLSDYYLKMIKKYKQLGLEDMANDLFYIEFDRYEGVLTIEEICIFSNYITMCSCNGQDIFKMLEMEEEALKEKLQLLSEFGY